MKDTELEKILAISEVVQKSADELLSNGLSETTFTCPMCSATVHVQLDYCCGVVADCETPDCLHMHMNLGLNFEECRNGTH